MMNESFTVGVDLGGTKILAALIDHEGKIKREEKIPTPKKRSEILEAVVSAVKKVKGKEEIDGLGVGFAGFVEKGIVISSPNVPEIKNVDVKRFLEKEFSCKVAVENDANMFAVGEWFYGLKHKPKNFIGITVGTGIGSGVIADGKLLKGKGIAAELGHTVIAAGSDTKCMCGKAGCFEAMVHSKTILARAEELGLSVKSPEHLALLAGKGNKKAKKVVAEAAKFLGIGLANAANSFDPEAIVVGGGLANLPGLVREAEKEMRRSVVVKNRARVYSEKMKGKAGVLGAALCSVNEFVLGKKHPLVAVDCVIEFEGGVVLLKRRFEPRGWAVPGGLVEYGESLESAVRREVFEETGLSLTDLRQFRAYSSPKRDPRQHCVSIVFSARGKGVLRKNRESDDIKVFRISRFPGLVFDHRNILKDWAKEFKEQKQ